MSTDPQCIFCQIARGEIPSRVVFEDDEVLAFLDIAPLAPGHLLIVTKSHYATMEQAPAATAGALGTVLPRLVAAVREVTGAAGVNVLQNNGRCAGQEVEHVHVHLIPRRDGDGLGYRWRAGRYAEGEADAIRDRMTRWLAG